MPPTPIAITGIMSSLFQLSFIVSVFSGLIFIGSKILDYTLDSTDTDSSKQIQIAIISGVVGSIAFAAVNPLITCTN